MFKRLVASLLAFMGYTGLVSAQKQDYSHVDSREKAQSLYAEGKLEKVFLMPLEYGGEDIEVNVVYVPPGIGALKGKIDGTVAKMAEDGSIRRYSASPEYKGKSFVPAKINIRAYDPGEFSASVDVW